LKQATRRLSSNSAARVRSEIQEHYESAREAAMSRGASAAEADLLAVAALGDARTANCEYRKVLLTAVEARMLRDANWEARALCSRVWVKRAFLAVPAAALLAAATFFLFGSPSLARVLLAGGIERVFFWRRHSCRCTPRPGAASSGV
jgi:hypothetical protein